MLRNLLVIQPRDAEEEYLEADEVELEEQRRSEAAATIQGAYRAYRDHRSFRALLKANFVKEYNLKVGRWEYRNKHTGAVYTTKPAFLGDDDAEAVAPSVFQHPPEYDPGCSSVLQYALVVTVQSFESSKIPPLPEQVMKDHEVLQRVLQSPYLCKYEPAHCTFLTDPTCEVLRTAIAAMSRAVAAGSKRQTEQLQALDEIDFDMGADGDAYTGAVRPTTPTTSSAAVLKAPSSLFLLYLCTHAATIRNSKPKSLNGSYILAKDSSWRTNASLAESSISTAELAALVAAVRASQRVVVLDTTHRRRDVAGDARKTRVLYPPSDMYQTVAEAADALVIGSCHIGEPVEVDLSRIARSQAGAQVRMPFTHVPPSELTALASDASGSSGSDSERSSSEATDGEHSEQEAPRHGKLQLQQRTLQPPLLKRLTRGGSRFSRKQQSRKRVMHTRPTQSMYESALYTQSGSLFGAAFAEGLQGTNVPCTASGRLRAFDVVQAVQGALRAAQSLHALSRHQDNAAAADAQHESAASALTQAATPGATDETGCSPRLLDGSGNDPGSGAMQCSTLAVPSKWTRRCVLRCTLGCVPSPPPCPCAAVCTELSARLGSALVQWQNQNFSGLVSERYAVEMRGDQRNNTTWTDVTPRAAPLTVPHYRIPRLPPGSTLQFRIRAWNRGGWSTASTPSPPVCVPQAGPTALRATAEGVKGVAKGAGVVGVCERMARHAFVLDVQLHGLRQIVAAGTTRGTLPLDLVTRAVDTVAAACTAHHSNTAVASNSQWALKHLRAAELQHLRGADTGPRAGTAEGRGGDSDDSSSGLSVD
ncbi:hypothetical protein JKP88DRAFT_254383 [Tribonema minus]|uniref:Fibronectin type-III domain-containing protein n=1 Tax=Tribonema minus TaxID=303371 RepID=A0A835Z481_9STRA|nr:hypothetical protein JKP88DRAFT_254383 [Tribonema minus]